MGGIDAIGRTPVVRLAELAGADSAEIRVKPESANPTGSYKDRTTLAMIEGTERAERLSTGQPAPASARPCRVPGRARSRWSGRQ